MDMKQYLWKFGLISKVMTTSKVKVVLHRWGNFYTVIHVIITKLI